jgi:ankyrin repeat protein
MEQRASRKQLSQTYADLMEHNGKDWLDLMCALEDDNIESAKSIINKKTININLRDDEGFSALMLAACYGYTEIVDSLISAGADLNLQNNEGFSALMLASYYGHADIVDSLINAAAVDLTLTDNNGASALIFAAQTGKTRIVKSLISAGADRNLQTNTGVSALIIASKKGKTDTVKSLIEAGAALNLQTNTEASALIAAAKEGHIDIVKLLIEKGADTSTLASFILTSQENLYRHMSANPLTLEDKKHLIKLYIMLRASEEMDITNCIKKGITAFFKPEHVYTEKIKVAEDLLKAVEEGQGFSGDSPVLKDGRLKEIYELCFEPGNPRNLGEMNYST